MSGATLSLIRGSAWAPDLMPAHWAAWAHGETLPVTGTEVAPAVAFIPAMQRRRLSRPARMAIQVAVDCLAGESADYLVWSSRHGDGSKTLASLGDLSQSNTLSPTAFSTSVHNAPVGLYAIFCQDTTPALSLSAGPESFSQACWEAVGLITSGTAKRVLIVCYDEPAPAPYADFVREAESPFALALLVGDDNSNGNRFQIRLGQAAQDVPEEPEAQAFWRFWLRGERHHKHGRHQWERL